MHSATAGIGSESLDDWIATFGNKSKSSTANKTPAVPQSSSAPSPIAETTNQSQAPRYHGKPLYSSLGITYDAVEPTSTGHFTVSSVPLHPRLLSEHEVNAVRPTSTGTFTVSSVPLHPKALSERKVNTAPHIEPPAPSSQHYAGTKAADHPLLQSPANPMTMTAPSTNVWTGPKQYAPKGNADDQDPVKPSPSALNSPSNIHEFPYKFYGHNMGIVGQIVKKAFGSYYLRNPCRTCGGYHPTAIHDIAIRCFMVFRQKVTLLDDGSLPTCTKHWHPVKGHSNDDCGYHEYCDHP